MTAWHRRRRVRLLAAAALVLPALWGGERLLDVVVPYPLGQLQRHGESIRVLARDGRLLRLTPTAMGERLIRVSADELSPHLRHALLAAEDARFYAHGGVDFAAVMRAIATNAWRGRVVSGASTLTMQLARIVEPRRRSVGSKLIEMVRARQLERQLSKDEILEAYCNLVPLGGTLRGFEAGARWWFGKQARDLAPEEAATLVAMLPAPTRRAPDRAPDLLRWHRNRVLTAMQDAGFLDEAEHGRATAAPLAARPHSWPWLAPHACDLLLATSRGPVLATGIDPGRQRAVEQAVRERDAAGCDGVAVVVLDRRDGDIRALVGSPDWRRTPLNAAGCRRSAGSTLKPFLYALAAQSGASGPDAIVLDTDLRFATWRPRNFDEELAGPMRAADALAASRNLPAIRLLRDVGVDAFRDCLRAYGLRLGASEIHLDAALGTFAASPLDLARAYWRFAAPGGTLGGLAPHHRRRVLDALARSSPDPAAAAVGRIAWKTGTSSGRRDAWSIGVTEDHVVVVWLGNLSGRGAPDLVGARAASRLMARVACAL